MEKSRFEGICKLATSGKIKWVDNLEKNRAGRVVSCTERGFEVELEGKHETWDPNECKERTYGYRMVYQ